MVSGLATTIREQVNPNAGAIRVVRRVTPKRNRSTKQTWVICPCCHTGRWVYYSDLSRSGHTGMCRKCYEANYRHTEEEKAKISKAQIGRVSGMKGKRQTELAKARIAEGSKEMWATRVRFVPQEVRQKIRDSLTGKCYLTEEGRQRLREIHKALWQDPEYIKKIQESWQIRPTRIELTLSEIIQELDLPYEYVGDGQFWLGFKCPDFLNINGQKKLIELFGDYWHKPQDELERKKHFARYGFQTLVIWESELKDQETLNHKLLSFNKVRK